MNFKTHASRVFLALTFATTVGCNRESAALPAKDESGTTAAKLEKVKQETREAVDASKEYAFAQRAEYAAKLREELVVFNQELDELSAKIEKSTASAKEEAKLKLAELRGQVARLNTNLDGVSGATESTWDEVKAGAKKGYEEMKDSFKQARQWLRDKVSP